MTQIFTLDSNNYTELALTYTEGPVMIDFWADWCEPCKALLEGLPELAAKAPTNARICTLNVDENQDVAEQFMVMGLPTCIFIKNGEEVERFSGIHKHGDYIEQLETLA